MHKEITKIKCPILRNVSSGGNKISANRTLPPRLFFPSLTMHKFLDFWSQKGACMNSPYRGNTSNGMKTIKEMIKKGKAPAL